MSTVKIIFDQEDGSELVRHAISAELKRLEIALNKTEREIRIFEERYNITSDKFSGSISAEDLRGGDEEYVHWSGELQLRERIARDIEQLKCIEYVHH